MYEKLTAHIPKLQGISFGTWADEYDVAYADEVYAFEEEVHRFIRDQSERVDFGEVLSKANIKRNMSSIRSLEVNSLSGEVVIALLIHVFHKERISAGTLLDCLHEGLIEKWLLRLQEIDNQQGE